MRAEKLRGMQERVPARYTAVCVCVCVYVRTLAAAAYLHKHQRGTKMQKFAREELGLIYLKQ